MDDNSKYQLKYWKELVQLKFHLFYLDDYFEQSELRDRGIKIFLAVTSNVSICGWAIWQKYQFMWAIIIATSQLVNAVKSFLPYKKRLQIIPALIRDLEELFLYSEKKWFQVAEGKLTEENIHNLHIEIKQRKNKIIQKHFGSISLTKKTKLTSKAEEEAKVYFNNFYNVED